MLVITSDPHVGHENIITKMGRYGFSSIEEHDDYIIEGINLKAGPKDDLIIAGDIAWKDPNKVRMRIKCKRIRVVCGNHDRFRKLQEAFGEKNVYQRLEAKLFNGEKAVVDHYPMAFWNRSHYGQYHFYGHMHMMREETLDTIWPERRSMDIGPDNARHLLGDLVPFTEYELMEILKDRKGHDQVEFYRSWEMPVIEGWKKRADRPRVD